MVKQIETNDVVIVGGGLAGLCAAVYLSRAEMHVTLFEKATGLGGRASTEFEAGFYLNRGIHALYCGGAAEGVLKELNVVYHGHSPTATFALRRGKLYPAPADPFSLLRTGLLAAGAKLGLVRLFAGLGKSNPHELRHVTVQAWLEREIQHPQVRQLMTATARTFVYSSALDVASAEVFLTRIKTALKHQVLYLDGGWKTLVEGLKRAATQAGAQFVSSAKVEAVYHQAGQVNGVRLKDGSTARADIVLIATEPKEALKLAGSAVAPAFRRMVEDFFPVQIACLDVALSRLPQVEYPVVQDLEQPRFLSAQSQFARVAPQGAALIHTFKQLDPRRLQDPSQDEKELEELLDIVQPGWREALVKRVDLPRIAAVGMLPTAASGGYAGRPGPKSSDIQGLYFAGDWIGPEGFLADASFASARQASRLIIRESAAARENGEKMVSSILEMG